MASAILTLVIIELGFVIFHPIPFSIEKNMYFEPDPFTGYKLKPNSVGYFQQQIPAQTNKNGHRDELVSVEKTDGVFRILVIGDSFTVGANVVQDDVYPEALETLLNRNATVPVEVINAGVGGWQPFHYAQYYEHYGWKFSPDLTLIGFPVGSDTYNQITKVHQSRTAVLGRRVSREAALGRFIRFKVFMYNHSNIARLILYKGPNTGNVSRQHCLDFTDQYLEMQSHRMRNHLKRTKTLEEKARNSIDQIKRIKNLAERNSIPLVVILIPDENQINSNLQQVLLTDEERDRFDFEMPQSMLKDMFADAAVPIIDLLPNFLEDTRCLYMNDTHWTAEGHALAARIIYEYITNEKIWPNITRRFSGRHKRVSGECRRSKCRMKSRSQKIPGKETSIS
jgi:hypothetical protein